MIPYFRQASISTAVPLIFVSRKTSGFSIDRSTWLSAAKLSVTKLQSVRKFTLKTVRTVGKDYRRLKTVDFLRYVEEKVTNAGWSIDACVGYAIENQLFNKDEMVCTKTLYNYVDTGLLNITNMDLPEKL